jgi:hypothetical protein
VAPLAGWRAWGRAGADFRIWDGAGWLGMADLVPYENLPGLGVNAAPDLTNRLAVSSPAVLLTHEGAGHQLKINKAAAGDTASLLYQTGFSGRAEMGLAGSDAFSIKVSPDGSAWTSALTLAAATGLATGAAVQSSLTDSTAGRLLTTGAFGIASAMSTTDLNTALTPGFYFCGSGAANIPVALTCVIFVQRPSPTGNAIIQQLWGGGSGGPVYRRLSTNTGSTWGAWRLVYDQYTVLGTVSQSAGIPTGALIERGSNANGEYVRFADGTLRCTRTMTLSAGAATTWTFPSAFIAAPQIGGAVVATVLSVLCLDAAPTTTSASLSARDKTDARRADVVHLTANGRWF